MTTTKQRGQLIPKGDNKWLIRVFRGRTTEGKREYKAELFHGSERQARRHLTAMLRQSDTGMLPRPSSETVAQYLKHWLKNVAPLNAKPRTLASYDQLIRLYILPAIGGQKLAKLGRGQVAELYGAMRARGLSPRTIRYTHSVLRAALNKAEDAGKIVRNPTTHAPLPKLTRVEPRQVGGTVAQRVCGLAAADEQAALWLLMITTALRPGEVLALRWSDIDGNVAHVRRTLLGARNGLGVFDTPKTKESARAVPIAEPVQRALKKHRAAQAAEKLRIGEHYQDQGLVFAGPTGAPMDVTSGVRRRLRTMLRKAGAEEREALDKARASGDPVAIRGAEAAVKAAELPALRLYDLRHMALTVAMENGVHPRIAADLAGHSTPTLTLATYSHGSVGQREQAVQAISDALFPSPNKGDSGQATAQPGKR